MEQLVDEGQALRLEIQRQQEEQAREQQQQGEQGGQPKGMAQAGWGTAGQERGPALAEETAGTG